MSVPAKAEGAILTAARAVSPVDLSALAGSGGILVLAPHPDDETLGCGAAIMAALAEGRHVTVALLTGGGMSHPASRTHPPSAMTSLRRREFGEALERLSAGAGGRPIASVFLGLDDGSVPHEDRALAPFAHRLADTAQESGIDTIWCTWRGDPHCDHVAAARLADLVEARLAEGGRAVTRRDYPIWGRFVPEPCAETVLSFPLGHWQRAKAHAMVSYASQLTHLVRDDPDGFVMPPALTAHFARAPEIFLAPPR